MRGFRLLLLLSLSLALYSCRCSRAVSSTDGSSTPSAALPPVASTASPVRLDAQELVWDYPNTDVGPMRVVVVVPERHDPDQRFPVLIAMHGHGETLKGPERGARGWIDDYWMPRALKRLGEPPLTRRDFLGMIRSDRLQAVNAALAREPYRGLVVVCPYTPDRLAGDLPFERAEPLAKFLVDDLLPRVRRETPARQESQATGIDGVSLGGRASLLAGLLRPDAFGVISTLQPAFDAREASGLAERAQRAIRRNPQLRFRLVTSSRDYYLASTREIAREFRAAGVEPNLLVVEGNHSYDFNRGPGVYEMLIFHDRSLRGKDWP